MKRTDEKTIKNWCNQTIRKPLVIRGARQVGKSTMVRQVAKGLGVPLWEVNLERFPDLDEAFGSFDVARILQEISLRLNLRGVGRGPGILFLDEIQAAPKALAALRYFHEDRPDIPVISAGSLLELTLSKAKLSMPVGRIEYLWMGPMTFFEFLKARSEDLLLETLRGFRRDEAFPAAAHERLLPLLREYLLVGGMPEAVARFAESRDPVEAVEVHRSIIETYKDDFSKYASGAELERLRRVYEMLPSAIAEKIRYNRFHPDWRAADIRACLELLQRAGIASAALHTDGTGLPLDATEDPTVAKLFHLDVGLVGTSTGLGMGPLGDFVTGRFINEGTRAEQFVAQHLLRRSPASQQPKLHYWQRAGRSTNAEVDFLVENGTEVLPIEVKSGASGGLRSLHQLMLLHPGEVALRLDLNLPSRQEIRTEVMTAKGRQSVRYFLQNLPLYLVERATELLRE